jgi:DNA invertase Pin-like site-specific DNA recombinase
MSVCRVDGNMITDPKPKAYSYIRFSTPDQIRGDSKRRQIDETRRWCDDNGYELDETLTDEGLSGYKGHNISYGNLGQFIARCEDGEIPKGSVLVVESFDRLSRQGSLDAHALIKAILNHVDLVITTLPIGIITRKEFDHYAPVVSSLISVARFESEQKQRRLKAAWVEKRAKAEEGYLISERLPAWIKAEEYDKSPIDTKTQILKNRDHRDRSKSREVVVSLIPERAEIVRQIFKRFNKCQSIREITNWLNKSGIETWNKGSHWHKSYIGKILSYPQAYGALELHQMEGVDDENGVTTTTRKSTGKVVKDYFPKTVSKQLWDKAQARRNTGISRGARPGQNPLSAVCICPKCGSTMTRVFKGKRGGKVRLVCVNNNESRGCDFDRLILENIDKAVVSFFKRWIGVESFVAKHFPNNKSFHERLTDIDRNLEKLNKERSSTPIVDQIIKLSRERMELVMRMNYHRQTTPKQFRQALETFMTDNEPSVRNSALRKIVSKIIVHSETKLEVYFRGNEKPWKPPELEARGSVISRN